MVYKKIARALPQRCLCCDTPSHPHRICSGCRQDLPWITTACAVCGITLDDTGAAAVQTCGNCQQKPPPIDRCIAPLRYEFPLPSLLTRFKEQRRLAYGAALADLLAQHLRENLATADRPQCLVPVPLHWIKHGLRGFNQAQLLAQDCGHQLQLPVRCDLLKRTHRAPAQHTLSARERQHNLRDAFCASDACTQFRHIAIVDDVVTTMTTANTLAQLLKRKGVARVDIWAVARTPKHSVT